MPKPICVECKRFYRCKKTGVWVAENMPKGYDAEPGLSQPEQWVPYKVWHADLYQCEGCGNEIIVGFGNNPVSIQHMDDFPDWHKLTTVTVNDC